MSMPGFCPGPAQRDAEASAPVKCYAYLDIETTGFRGNGSELTVVGVGLVHGTEHRFGQLFGDQIQADRLLGLLAGADEIYTFNGARFDLPFIRSAIGVDLRRQFAHTDLMHACRRQDLRGGLKAVEARLGIRRRLPDVNGYMAVQLWWDYVNNNNFRSLQMLLDYNRADVMNLHTLRERLGVR